MGSDGRLTVVLQDCPHCKGQGYLFPAAENAPVQPVVHDEETILEESLEMSRCKLCDGRGKLTPGHALRIKLGQLVTEHRRQLGLTLNEAAEQWQVAPNWLAGLEFGQVNFEAFTAVLPLVAGGPALKG